MATKKKAEPKAAHAGTVKVGGLLVQHRAAGYYERVERLPGRQRLTLTVSEIDGATSSVTASVSNESGTLWQVRATNNTTRGAVTKLERRLREMFRALSEIDQGSGRIIR